MQPSNSAEYSTPYGIKGKNIDMGELTFNKTQKESTNVAVRGELF
jgi:hypothetical protein